MSQHIPPRTTIFYIWHVTPQSASHHHFTPPHLKVQHIPRTATVHISHHSTPTTIPHHTHIQHHSTFHTTPYSTSHYTAVSIPPPFHTTTSQSTTYSTSHSHSPHLTPFHIHIHNYSTPHPQSTSQHISPHTIFHIALHQHILISHHTTTSDIATHCIIFHIRHLAAITQHVAYATFFITTIPHHISHHIMTIHILHYATFHILHFNHISHHTMSEVATDIPHRTTFKITTSRHTIPQQAHIPLHTMPCTSPLSNINYTSHYPTVHSKPQHTSHTAFQPSFHITPCLIWRQTIPHHPVFHDHISPLASQHTTIFPMHHTIIPHRITTFHASPDITFSIAPYCTYLTSHLFPPTSQPH